MPHESTVFYRQIGDTSDGIEVTGAGLRKLLANHAIAGDSHEWRASVDDSWQRISQHSLGGLAKPSSRTTRTPPVTLRSQSEQAQDAWRPVLVALLIGCGVALIGLFLPWASWSSDASARVGGESLYIDGFSNRHSFSKMVNGVAVSSPLGGGGVLLLPLLVATAYSCLARLVVAAVINGASTVVLLLWLLARLWIQTGSANEARADDSHLHVVLGSGFIALLLALVAIVSGLVIVVRRIRGQALRLRSHGANVTIVVIAMTVVVFLLPCTIAILFSADVGSSWSFRDHDLRVLLLFAAIAMALGTALFFMAILRSSVGVQVAIHVPAGYGLAWLALLSPFVDWYKAPTLKYLPFEYYGGPIMLTCGVVTALGLFLTMGRPRAEHS